MGADWSYGSIPFFTALEYTIELDNRLNESNIYVIREKGLMILVYKIINTNLYGLFVWHVFWS